MFDQKITQPLIESSASWIIWRKHRMIFLVNGNWWLSVDTNMKISLWLLIHLIIACNGDRIQLEKITKKLNLIPKNLQIKPKEYLASKYDQYDRSQILLGILLENYSTRTLKPKQLETESGGFLLEPEDIGPFSSKFAALESNDSNFQGSISWLLDASTTLDVSFKIPYRRYRFLLKKL